MSDLLSIGASGIGAYRAALTVVGDNIVNAETPGYARRKVVVQESSATAGTNALYKDRVNFGGVDPVGVQRAWDEFKAADARLAGSTASRADARARWLAVTETALGDGASGVGQTMTAVFTAGETLASDPGNAFQRRAFIAAVDEAAGAFRTTADALARTADGIAAEAKTVVAGVNADITQLATLNVALRRGTPGTSSHTQLSDERDRLLDTLSDRIEIEAVVAKDGTVTVKIPRSGGLTLVDSRNVDPAVMTMAASADGRLSLSLFSDGEMSSYIPGSGALAGLVETAGTVAGRRAQLDTVAAHFADALNGWHEGGTDANGAAGTALFAYDPLRAAASLAPAVADRDPATVAAALSVTTIIDNGDGTTSTRTDTTANGNMLGIAALRTTAGTEKGWANLVATQSQVMASARSEETGASARRTAAYAARDEVAGVDLDAEASDLLRFQQAYNGSAKVIQVARETLQTIMDLL